MPRAGRVRRRDPFLRASLAAEREAGGRGRVAGTLVRGAASWWALGYFDRALAWVQRGARRAGLNGRAGPSAAAADVRGPRRAAGRARGRRGRGGRRSTGRARASARESRHALYQVCLGDAVPMARRQHRHERRSGGGGERVARESGMVLEGAPTRAAAAEAAAALGDRVAARAWLDLGARRPAFRRPVRAYRATRWWPVRARGRCGCWVTRRARTCSTSGCRRCAGGWRPRQRRR